MKFFALVWFRLASNETLYCNIYFKWVCITVRCLSYDLVSKHCHLWLLTRLGIVKGFGYFICKTFDEGFNSCRLTIRTHIAVVRYFSNPLFDFLFMIQTEIIRPKVPAYCTWYALSTLQTSICARGKKYFPLAKSINWTDDVESVCDA